MTYYHNLITDKSWQLLQQLKKEFQFILIGGWAVWLYAQTLKSKDIDFIVDYDQLELIRKSYNLFKNDRLKKYEIKVQQTDVDIYVPFYSNLGISAEKVIETAVSLQGFRVPRKEMLLLLKQKAFEARGLSVKGRKDYLDIFSLILLPDFDWRLYQEMLKKYKLTKLLHNLKKLIKESKAIQEFDLNTHQVARLKKKLLANL